MFGQSSTSNTFGGGNNSGSGFGAKPTSATPSGLLGNPPGSNSNNGSMFGNNTGSTNGGLFGSNSNTTSAAPSTGLFGSNNSTGNSTGALGSNNNTTAGSGNLFGNATNNTTATGTPGTTGGLFGNSTGNMNATQSNKLFGNSSNGTTAPTGGLFGNTNSSSNTTGSTGGLFGNNTNPNTQQSGGLFGNSNNNAGATATGGLFGNTMGQNKPTTGLFGSTSQNPQQNPALGANQNMSLANNSAQGQSLFQKGSLFSVSSSDADASQYRDLMNQNKQAQNHFSNTNESNHHQSLLTGGSNLKQSNTSSWATDRHTSFTAPSANLKHASSFNTAERVSMGVRKASFTSQSPSNTFGSSFSGTSKPLSAKKKQIIQEDPPPTRSIYDNDATNMTSTVKVDPNTTVATTEKRSHNPSPVPAKDRTSDYSRSVVIFGFPPALTSTVVAHFSKFGNILENVNSSQRIEMSQSTPKGPPKPIFTGKNWLKITYENSASASRAVQENGVIIATKYVIGCIPVTAYNYKDIEVASEFSSTPQAEDEFPSFNESNTEINTSPSANDNISGNKSILPTDGTMLRSSSAHLIGSKRVELKDGHDIFKKNTKPSKVNLQKSVVLPTYGVLKKSSDKPLQSSEKQGWLNWTGKKAQELVFGWDDL